MLERKTWPMIPNTQCVVLCLIREVMLSGAPVLSSFGGCLEAQAGLSPTGAGGSREGTGVYRALSVRQACSGCSRSYLTGSSQLVQGVSSYSRFTDEQAEAWRD